MRDARWRGEARCAVGYATALLVLLVAVDGAAGRLSAARAAAWTVLALALLAVLMPARVSAGEGWLASRGLFRQRVVRTDRLVSVRWSDGVAERLVLRDTSGGRVELDPRTLLATPQLWHLLDAAARASLGAGTLRHGAAALHRLSARLDKETAELVFRQSGLD